MSTCKTLLILGIVGAMSACTTLSPGQRTAANIACKVDAIAQPIGLPFIAGLPTVGGIAATVDAALIHPLVQKACQDLAASLGTSGATPVLAP